MKKSLITLLSTIAGAVAGAALSGILSEKTNKKTNEKIDKFRIYYNMLNQWLVLKQENKSIESYFTNNEYKTIAIYGMGEMGNRLYEDLKDTEIKVRYAIDKNAGTTYSKIELKDIGDELEIVDVVIVTAVFAFDEIQELIADKFDCPIISLEEVIYEV